MVGVTNADIAAVFEHVADLLEYQGDNVFRVRAYRNAARTIGGMVESLATRPHRSRSGRSPTSRGSATDLAAKIGELLDTGRLGAARRPAASRCPPSPSN